MCKHPVCRDDQEGSKYIDNPAEMGNQGNPEKDHDGPENYCAQNTVEQNFVLVFLWY